MLQSANCSTDKKLLQSLGKYETFTTASIARLLLPLTGALAAGAHRLYSDLPCPGPAAPSTGLAAKSPLAPGGHLTGHWGCSCSNAGDGS